MFEKVNPAHPDKLADRIAGAIVDCAYKLQKDPQIAVEVLVGHHVCNVIAETSVDIPSSEIVKIVNRISGDLVVNYTQVYQDEHLSANQRDGFRCGDNGIFKGAPVTREQEKLSAIARKLYDVYESDGKCVLDLENDRLIICQSNAKADAIRRTFPHAEVNPLGDWTGGIDVDTGATNRKLGSDMGDSVTGGGLHGKDLSKADVSVNIYAWLEAQKTGKPVELCCAIGDEFVGGKPYSEIVDVAREFIDKLGGFEKFAEWGLIR